MKPSKRTLQTRRTEKERAELVERFKHSGLTRVAFARQNGVALSTLAHWLTQEKSRSKLPLVRDGHFQKLTPSLHSPVVFGEVELMSGIELSLRRSNSSFTLSTASSARQEDTSARQST